MTVKSKPVPPVEVEQYEEPRGIFESIKLMFSSVADVAIHSAGALGTGAKAMNSLANAGLIMAESNEKLVTIKTKGKEAVEMSKLEEMYKL